MSGKYDIDIYQGATLSFDFTMENEDGAPVDLSLATVYMQIRQNHRSNELMLDLKVGGYIWIDDPMNGKVKINIPGSITSDLYIRTTGVYDIVLEFTDGNRIKPLAGLVVFHPEVTKV